MTEGCYFYRRDTGYLLEVSRGWGIGLEFCHFQDNASLHIMPMFGSIFIKLPRIFWREVPIGEIMSGWGFTWRWGRGYAGRDIHLNWGAKSKIIHLPWDYAFIRHDVLMADGTWKRVSKTLDGMGRPWEWTNKFQEAHDYTYILRNGTVQRRKATIGVEEREWRQKWLKWCPWFAKVSRTIDIAFDGEVGERTGSWKGGVTGCGYQLRLNETPLECLRRMEGERKFT